MKAEIIRTEPKNDVYFKRETLEYGTMPEATESRVINLYDEVKYRQILGFGAAITESSAYNYSLLSPEDKKKFLTL